MGQHDLVTRADRRGPQPGRSGVRPRRDQDLIGADSREAGQPGGERGEIGHHRELQGVDVAEDSGYDVGRQGHRPLVVTESEEVGAGRRRHATVTALVDPIATRSAWKLASPKYQLETGYRQRPARWVISYVASRD